MAMKTSHYSSKLTDPKPSDPLTPQELAVATKVFGLLAKWKRESLARQKYALSNHTLPVNSNSDLIDNPNQPMQK